MNLSYVILACIAPVAVLILILCGAPAANARATAHSAALKPRDSQPAAEPPAPSTDRYAVQTEGRLNRVNHYPRNVSKGHRAEVQNTHTPYKKSKFESFENARALGWSHVMQNPLRNLNDAQAAFHKFDRGEASNFMGNVEIRRAKPFLPGTERGDEECALRVNGVRFQGQDFVDSDVGKRRQPRPKRKRCDDRPRTHMTRGASRALAFPQRGHEELRPTRRNRRKEWEMMS